MPRESRFVEAFVTDDEMAAVMPTPSKNGDQGPRVSEWDMNAQLLAAVFDRLGELINVQVQTGGGKKQKIPPFPRPQTAAERVAKKRQKAKHDALTARVLPHKRKE